MRALTWQGKRKVSVETVPDPTIEHPTDAIIKVTSTAICGSDLHLYEVLAPFLDQGDVLGHEPMGIVEEVGAEVTHIKPGDRVVIPFNISCGHCFMCNENLQTQCETTQNRDQGTGASLLGYTKLYGQVPGGQAEYLRVPQAQYGPIKVPEGPPDERFLFLSDVLPTAWQAVQYAHAPDETKTLGVIGLGPIGQMCARISQHLGVKTFAVDFVPERIALARKYGIEVLDMNEVDDVAGALREMTDGRGPDSMIDAVGMEAHGAGLAKAAQTMVGLLPDRLAQPIMENTGTDRTGAIELCIESVRRGGSVSLSGVYGGTATPINLLQAFDKQIGIRMGQANVKRWVDDIMPLLGDDDPLGTEDLATHKVPLEQAPDYYEIFQKKEDGAIKVVLKP